MPSDKGLAVLDDAAGKVALQFRIHIEPGFGPFEPADDRQEEVSPYAGGARVVPATGDPVSGEHCSTGFGYRMGGDDYMLTAGHCFPQGTPYHFMWTAKWAGTAYGRNVIAGNRQAGHTSWNTSSGTVQGGLDNGWHGDLAIVNVSVEGRQAGDMIWWGGVNTTAKIPVTERIAPDFLDPVCFSGMISGADCGLITAETNGVFTLRGETLKWADTAVSSSTEDCPKKGDSGAPVVFNHGGAETQATAVGIVAGFDISDGDCTMVFTGAEEAIQRWGGFVRGE